MAKSDEDPGQWVLVVTNEEDGITTRRSEIVHMRFGFPSDGSEPIYESIEAAQSLASPAPPYVRINCSPLSPEEALQCSVRIIEPIDIVYAYTMPIANLSSNRFFAEDDAGNTIEGFRVNYD